MMRRETYLDARIHEAMVHLDRHLMEGDYFNN
jgi:hypothetical protein